MTSAVHSPAAWQTRDPLRVLPQALPGVRLCHPDLSDRPRPHSPGVKVRDLGLRRRVALGRTPHGLGPVRCAVTARSSHSGDRSRSLPLRRVRVRAVILGPCQWAPGLAGLSGLAAGRTLLRQLSQGLGGQTECGALPTALFLSLLSAVVCGFSWDPRHTAPTLSFLSQMDEKVGSVSWKPVSFPGALGPLQG